MQPLVLSDISPTLCTLTIDFPDELGPILSSIVDERGTPPLLLQLFPLSPEGLSIEAYLLPAEVYPFRLCMCAIEELAAHLHPVATVSWFNDPHDFNLKAFATLTRLHVNVSMKDLPSVLIGCSTWSSDCRSLRISEFNLVVTLHISQTHLMEAAFHLSPLLLILASTPDNYYRALRGTFRLMLDGSILDKLKKHELVKATIADLFLLSNKNVPLSGYLLLLFSSAGRFACLSIYVLFVCSTLLTISIVMVDPVMRRFPVFSYGRPWIFR
ncbi:uncharacterized protein EV420DRAFT_1480827 [Desarmillaria tabescens]|uniref:Uncharacterized protein n=1 Tax=Armillaria tabescens TaxID=1929756 RepID=A0AA39KAN6_ARMTA|nr:uncharacterized protein EV420DRAFT_1480827 [Desarmillaria tabescens]KAK0457358.1 hypothetical protein EV420DRAFT_1480827 [Desarmillaria tabescens]